MKFFFDFEGWLKSSNNIKKIKSPNWNIRPKKTNIHLVVLHSISLPEGFFGGKNVEKFFLNQLDVDLEENKFLSGLKVSSHFYIRRNGKLVQFVSIFDRAWHAGESSFLNKKNCNDFSIGIELEGTDFVQFCDEQYITLLCLLFSLSETLPSLEFLTGHSYISPGRKTDPGPFFDWDKLSLGLEEEKKSWKIYR